MVCVCDGDSWYGSSGIGSGNSGSGGGLDDSSA